MPCRTKRNAFREAAAGSAPYIPTLRAALSKQHGAEERARATVQYSTRMRKPAAPELQYSYTSAPTAIEFCFASVLCTKVLTVSTVLT